MKLYIDLNVHYAIKVPIGTYFIYNQTQRLNRVKLIIYIDI